MPNRAYIIFGWCLWHVMLFLLLSMILPEVYASLIAMVLTVGAAFHPSNKHEYMKLKRYTLYVERN